LTEKPASNKPQHQFHVNVYLVHLDTWIRNWGLPFG